jgi:hypothetical protein
MPVSKRRKAKHQGPTPGQQRHPIFESRLTEHLDCCTAYVVTRLWANGDLDDRVTHANECHKSGKRSREGRTACNPSKRATARN